MRLLNEEKKADTVRVSEALGGYSSYSDFFAGVRGLATNSNYKSLPINAVIRAFGNAWSNNPYTQNQRIKGLRSQPFLYPRDAIEGFIKDAEHNELALRQVGTALNYSSYPFYKLKTTIASIPTYHWYYMPQYIDESDAKTEEYKRERKLVDKFCKRLNPKMMGRILTQSALDEGKIFRYMRIAMDKAHNQVSAVALQELPSDFCKIVGRNSDSYYTIAFDFTYFWRPGTSVKQFAPIFEKYLAILMSFTEETESFSNGKRQKIINMAKASKAIANSDEITVEKVNGRYFCWVNLPVNECFTFGLDFSSPIQAPMLMGLFLTGADLSQYEYLQKQLLQVPLYGVLTGEIPYHDEKNNSKKADDYRLSPTGDAYYRNLFYQMMNENDTSGIDVYFAPVVNLKLQHLDEIPNSADVVTRAYTDFSTKAGVTGIMSSTDKPMAALVASSQKIESQYAKLIYSQFMNMMDRTFETLGMKYSWRFFMFGDIFSDEKTLESARNGMTLGILPDTYIYNAMRDRTLEDDYAASCEMIASGIMDMRMPLQSSYTASSKDGNTNNYYRTGRPAQDVSEVESEKTEESIDQGTGENL